MATQPIRHVDAPGIDESAAGNSVIIFELSGSVDASRLERCVGGALERIGPCGLAWTEPYSKRFSGLELAGPLDRRRLPEQQRAWQRKTLGANLWASLFETSASCFSLVLAAPASIVDGAALERLAHAAFELYFSKTRKRRLPASTAISRIPVLAEATPANCHIRPDYVASAHADYLLTERRFVLSEAQSRTVRSRCRAMRVGVGAFLAAALLILLYRYSRRSPVAVLAGREPRGFGPVIGDVAKTKTVKALIRSVATQLSNIRSGRQRSDVRSPHGSELTERFIEDVEYANEDLSVRPSYVASADALTLCAERGGDRVAGRLLFRSELYEKVTTDRVLESYSTILENMVRMLAEPPSRVRYISQQQATELRAVSTGVQVEVERKLLHEYFEAVAARQPDQTAVVCGSQKISYRELELQADALAAGLRSLGAAPGRVVGLLFDRSIRMVVTIMAVLKTGAAFAPVETKQPLHRIRQIASQPLFDIFLTDDGFADRIDDSVSFATALRGAAAAKCGSESRARASFGDLMYVLHTSGSTGAPKAVGVEHSQYMHYHHSRLAVIGSLRTARFAMVSTFAADLGYTPVFPTLAEGGTVHIIPEELLGDADRLAHHFRVNSIDCLKIASSHFQALVSATDSVDIVPNRLVILGGAATPWTFVDEVRRRRPGLRMINSFGHTETAIGATVFDTADGRQPHHSAVVPAGQPLANVELFVLDENEELVPFGVEGEIYIGGARVARGYLNNEEQTAARFVRHPFAKGENKRIFKSGDWGHWLFDGNVEFHGRRDDQVKIHGFRVECGEVERCLREVSGVSAAAVLPQAQGSSDSRLLAFLATGSADHARLLERIKAHVKTHLPSHMLPASFRFLDRLPLNANGKVDRTCLLELMSAAGPPLQAKSQARTSGTQAYLRELWERILKHSSFTLDDDFIDVGGSSLELIELVGRINKGRAEAQKIAAEELLGNLTIRRLSELIEAKGVASANGN